MLQSMLGKILRSFHSLPSSQLPRSPLLMCFHLERSFSDQMLFSPNSSSRQSSQLSCNIESSDSWNMSRMNDGALLLGGCDTLIGFLRKEITTELIESVCFRGCLAGYTPPLPVATNFRGCRVSPSRYRRQWLGRLYPSSTVGSVFRV